MLDSNTPATSNNPLQEDDPLSSTLRKIKEDLASGAMTDDQANLVMQGMASLITADPNSVARRMAKFPKYEAPVKPGNSYYRKTYALALKPVLDNMIERQVSKEISLSSYGTKSYSTLYALISNAWTWLIDNADPDHRYRDLRRKCKISKAAGKYLILLGDPDEVIPAKDVDANSFKYNPSQRLSDILDWIEQSSIGEKLPYNLQDVELLTDEQVLNIKQNLQAINSFTANPSYIYAFSNGKLRLLHVDPEKCLDVPTEGDGIQQ